MTDPAPRRRYAHWKGPRRLVQTRVPVDLAEQLRADAAAAGVTVSDHLGALLARALEQEEAPARRAS